MPRSPFFRLVIALSAFFVLASPVPIQARSEAASLEIAVSGIKSAKGVIRLALCPPAAGFPDCGDRAVRTATMSIDNGAARTVLTGLPEGSYAISVFHDSNSNGRLDTLLGIPKEGYGFSRNPPFRPRAPKWGETVIEVAGGASAAINLRYVL